MLASSRLVVILACAAALTGCRPLSSHPLAVEAGAELGRNPRVAEALGRPVTRESRVRGVVNETDGIAALTFEVKGPKGSGVVAVEGKKTQGAWGITLLELQPAGGTPLALTADIATDTPKFDPSAPPTAPSTTVAPPGDVEIALPPSP